jgi:hypothetical protein
MWFSHRECQREAAQKAVLGKSTDSAWIVGQAEVIHKRASRKSLQRFPFAPDPFAKHVPEATFGPE